MNLNAPLNPTSCGNLVWSKIIKIFPQMLGNYDGFNYLGLGVLFFIGLILLNQMVNFRWKRLYEVNFYRQIVKKIKQNIGIIFAVIVFFAFSLSNVVTFNSNIIFRYQLPSFIFNLCSIFRASSRMFYPIYYLIFLGVVVYLIKSFPKEKACLCLSALIVLQIFDISPALRVKMESFDSQNIQKQYESTSAYKAPYWNVLGENYKKAQLLNHLFDYDLALWIAKNRMQTNIDITNRGTDPYDYNGAVENLAARSTLEKDKVYITDDLNLANGIYQKFHASCSVYNLYNKYFAIAKKGLPLMIEELPNSPNACYSANFSDVSWDKGINRTSKIILFSNNKFIRESLKNVKALEAKNSKIGVLKVDIQSSDWIWVYCQENSDLSAFAYPNIIEVVK